jgi:hypothetical protein
MADRDEEGVEEPFATLVGALRAERRRCPPAERLLEHAEGRLAAADRRAMELHLAACVACSDLVARAQAPARAVDDLSWEPTARRLDRRRRPWARDERPTPGWRPRLAVAAILALAAAGLVWRLVGAPAEPVSAVRGAAALQVLAPAEEVESPAAVTVFEWLPALAATLYRLEIEADGEALWQETTRESRLAAPPEVLAMLAAGDELRWRVVGLSPSGAIALESPWTPLRLRAGSSAAAATLEDSAETGRGRESGEDGR